MILCVGNPEHAPKGRYSSSEFDSAVDALLNSESVSPVAHKINAAGRIVLLGEGRLARSTAEQVLMPAPIQAEPLLNEIPIRSYVDDGKPLPMEKWIKKAARQRKAADPRQPESQAEVVARADRLIEKLEAECPNALLITYPLFLTELLDRFRVHNYVVQRSGLLRGEPLEKILVSRKDEHCGCCQHNCFLSNPGCGIGSDKAKRQKNR